MLKKLTTLLAGGEAHALLTRTPSHSRDALVRVAVARGHVLLDVEKVFCAILSICSSKNIMLLFDGTSCTCSQSSKLIEAMTMPTSHSPSPQPEHGPRASERAWLHRDAAHYI